MSWLRRNRCSCAAAYETVDAALADLESIELAHMQKMIGQYDRP